MKHTQRYELLSTNSLTQAVYKKNKHFARIGASGHTEHKLIDTSCVIKNKQFAPIRAPSHTEHKLIDTRQVLYKNRRYIHITIGLYYFKRLKKYKVCTILIQHFETVL